MKEYALMSRHILCADDSSTIQRVVQITFAREDVRLTQARSTDEALAAARRDLPDVVLADASLDGKNGYELCAAIKADMELRGVPVIILTGTAGPWDESKGVKVGADAHVQKPFETQVLLDRVAELFAKAPPRSIEPRAVAPRPAEPNSSGPPASAAPSPVPKSAPALAPASSKSVPPASPVFGKSAPVPSALSAAPQGLGRPPLIGGGKLSRVAAAATAPKPAFAPDPVRQPAGRPMVGLPAQASGRVATPMSALPKPATAPPAQRPAPPPAVRAAIGERVAERVAQFAAGGPEYAAIAKLSREIIEEIAWEVVPDLAEAIIRSELDRLLQERDKNR
jgi:CheY-like chemotaxis protein